MIDLKFNLKIFSIDLQHYELRNKDLDNVIKIITKNHKNHLHASDKDFEQFKYPLQEIEDEDFYFYSYCYNQTKDQNYWKYFLPEELAKDQNFDLIEFSHVLFICYKNKLYCVTSGSGITVIKKYLDNYFGIELYQHFASLNDDITISINTRGVTGNLSQRSNTFNYSQSIKDSLLYSEIPKKLKVVIRKELRDGIFREFNLDDESSIMDLGSYFSLRKKINFEELKRLIVTIEKILGDTSNYKNLSLFNRVKDSNILEDLRNSLLEKIIEHILMHDQPENIKKSEYDIVEVVNSKQIEKFYECNTFRLHFFRKKKKTDLQLTSRDELYFNITKQIYNSLENISDRKEIVDKINQLSIIGIIDSKEETFDNFYNHLVTEITLNDGKYFRTDNTWFKLDNNYLSQIREEAINNYELYELKERILKPWNQANEDLYNINHSEKNYYVFDKKFIDNIELCDIMYYDKSTMYLIHVKDGFNTNMRSLYNQIVLSSQRLWHDINNIDGSTYLKDTIAIYNDKTDGENLNSDDILKKIREKDLTINFVMAYNNYSYVNDDALGKLSKTASNIALFSLVQTAKEVLNYNIFKFNVIDISQIK
ncbi:hypothetical protein ASG22_19685 [Chryseobacterium sp. Leaf405]|uniref:DUF6119 family protein n=1 Tax=Chryseobacterium sp. Leaf405 TaxID=1736367 RepID=UPI0006F5541E|nr:DUF6119 family protein [Chryseobacterium sp. Leaf405]KQT29548.1 hypothetical protein ASG22_19685 [Chryseobacterium sp. Leaf405]